MVPWRSRATEPQRTNILLLINGTIWITVNLTYSDSSTREREKERKKWKKCGTKRIHSIFARVLIALRYNQLGCANVVRYLNNSNCSLVSAGFWLYFLSKCTYVYEMRLKLMRNKRMRKFLIVSNHPQWINLEVLWVGGCVVVFVKCVARVCSSVSLYMGAQQHSNEHNTKRTKFMEI